MFKKALLFGTWACASVALTFLNSYVLNSGYPNPIFVSAMGQIFTAAYGCVFSVDKEDVKALREYGWRFVAVSLCSGYTLFASNAAYMYLSVAFAQILKAFNPVITGCILSAFRIQKVSPGAYVCLALMTLGTIIATNGKQNFSVVGTCLLLSAEVAECGRVVLTQTILQRENISRNAVSGLISALTVIFMIPSSFLKETPSRGLERYCFLLILAGCLGCATTISSAEIIKSFSSLTLKAAAQTRNAAVVFGSCFAGLVVLTVQQALGYLVVILTYFLLQFNFQ